MAPVHPFTPRPPRRARPHPCSWLLLAVLQGLSASACDDPKPNPSDDGSDGAQGANHEQDAEPEQDTALHCPDQPAPASPPVDFPPGAWCDGVIDCTNSAADESNCPDRQQLVCLNLTLGKQTLIDASKLCDGVDDCDPPLDELLCFSGVYCDLIGHERTLPAGKKCDGVWDCQNDEVECPSAGERFTCTSGKTIPLENACDGNAHCADGSDEAAPRCPGQIACPLHLQRGLVLNAEGPHYYRPDQYCDARVDCGAAVDELECGPYVHCTADLLLPRAKVCDGTPDCPDGRDEERCERVMR